MSVKTQQMEERPSTRGEPLPDYVLEHLAERFELDRELGRGGMANVWLAHRHGDDRPLAVKVLRPMLAEAIMAQRFLREIRIASAVKSTALVPLEESGEIHGIPYYVMPFAEGGSLRDRLRQDRHLRIDEAGRMARTIGTALAALHHAGFVHRDIKPENVLLYGAGEVCLADYGIAHAIAAAAKSDDLTSSGVVLGTPPYMSPEQAVGDPVDGRSDIYSLGCLLYELLAGEPPFHGATPQALIARHMYEQPFSLRAVRPTVPPPLEAIVMRMLAKVPADRFASADAFVAALDDLGELRDATTTWRDARWMRRGNLRALAATTGALAVAGIVYWTFLRPVPLDPDRVMVFPFASVGSPPEAGWAQLSMLVGSALERTETAKWLDGFSLLDEDERRTMAGLSERRARSLARRARARYYLDGSVSRIRDSVSVQVRLHDVSNGMLLDSKTESGNSQALTSELVLKAVVRVLPNLTGLEKVVDVSGLTGHHPAAVDNWLRGERAYRQSRMVEALRYFESAVSIDSLLVPAAFRAAAAASWTGKPDAALSYVRLTLRHPDKLSVRQRSFALALESYLAGRANEAMERLRPVLGRETETADGWMLAGEVQLHLLPTIGADSTGIPTPTTWSHESFAQRAFERARTLDPGFAPPLVHLAEMAARRGDMKAATRHARLLQETNTDSVLAMRLSLTERCMRDGAREVDWRSAARRSTATLFHVGAVLRASTDRRARQCALAAFQSVLAADTTQGREDWSSLVALHGMYAAQGEPDRALQLVDSAVASGVAPAVGLYVLDAVAGLEIGDRADPFVAQLLRNIDTRGAASLWLLTLWSARAGDTTTLAGISGRLTARAATSAQRLDTLMASIASAYLARARSDTALALRLFADLQPTAVHRELEVSLWEPLGTERLAYAELLLASGQAAEAHRMASTFDHPGMLVHDLFLLPSLELRARAARALRDSPLERRALDRITSLRTTGQ